MDKMDRRLIEAGFPCHQVGAETQRERGASSALPPLYFLHVWWARRPLTPSRAAIVASLAPEDTDPKTFVQQLGIEKRVVRLRDQLWTLTVKLLDRVELVDEKEKIKVDEVLLRAFEKEQKQRRDNLALIAKLKEKDVELAQHPVVVRWEAESQALDDGLLDGQQWLDVQRIMGDPAWAKERITFENTQKIRTADKYGYGRAYQNETPYKPTGKVVLDPTAGGGSIPFEALRLGHTVIANELNPVATTILYATLDYPARFGSELVEDIRFWGTELREKMVAQLLPFFPSSEIPGTEKTILHHVCKHDSVLIKDYQQERLDGFLYTRQVTCPHCQGEAPLLNTSWLSKEANDPWGIKVITDGKPRNGKVQFETYRISKSKGPDDEDPNQSTVNRGIGQCVHCQQAIDGDEVKRQARGESELGKWVDRLYTVVAVRYQPKLDKQGKLQYFKTGEKKGQIKTEKVRFFRTPNQRDLDALDAAKAELEAKWDVWDDAGLIPTERFPEGNDMRPVNYGMPRWCDMFTPRQLLGHVTLIEELNRLNPKILAQLGQEKGRAVVTYLQFAIDKGLDYNSRQTRWEFTRGIIKGTFGRHDYSLKWTFGEMIFTGPQSGAAWGLSQITNSYAGIAKLVEPLRTQNETHGKQLNIIHGTAAKIDGVEAKSVDLVCMDPPYYNNVQYAELSDYFYVWQKRTLKDLYPELFSRRFTDKKNEAVANPVRDGSAKGAKESYECLMSEIFSECRRTLKDRGLMTLMFTHKSQDAWETLTRSLIENKWIITSSFPVDSESTHSMNIMDQASAISSIFITCRKRQTEQATPAVWQGFGGQGVQRQIEQIVLHALTEFVPLKLNPVDEMVACYGRALQVLSENWPVMDGEKQVSPVRAMNEASRVVAQNRVGKITKGKITVEELDSETAMALTIYGIWGHTEVAYDDLLNLSRSLGIRLESKSAGYQVSEHEIGFNAGTRGKQQRTNIEYPAPLLRQGSKMRLVLPEERDPRRLQTPQTDWDHLHGLIEAYRKGDTPVARAYLNNQAKDATNKLLALLTVWTQEATDTNLRKEGKALLYGLK